MSGEGEPTPAAAPSVAAEADAAAAPGRVRSWLDERLGLADLLTLMRHKRVPVGETTSIFYYLGGVSLFLFLVQIATGILLLMYYRPGEATAHESLKELVARVPFGWLVRSAHCWSAHAMVACVLAHMFSVYFTKAYRRPRELTWLSGMALLGVTFGLGFSGYLLPWNELSFFATAVGTEMLKSVPLIGHWLLEVTRGGPEVSGATLHRFFALHVSALPLIGFGLLAVHLLLVQRHGMSVAIGRAPGQVRTIPFFPSFALRDLLLWVIVLNAIAVLSVLLPHGPGLPGLEWDLGQKADPLAPAPEGIKPEWYFLWAFQLLRETPPEVGGIEGPQLVVFLGGALALLWTAVPLLDRRAARGEPSPGFTDAGVGLCVLLGYLTLLGGDLAAAPTAVGAVAAGAVVTLARWRSAGGLASGRWTAAAIVTVGAHGLAGVGLLAVGAVAIGIAAAVSVARELGAKRSSVAAAALLLGIALPATARAQEEPPADVVPRAVKELLDDTDEATRARFAALPVHVKRRFYGAVDGDMLSNAEQLAAFLALDLADEQLELLLLDNCVLCHTNPDLTDDNVRFRLDRAPDDPYRHLDLREVVADVHLRRGLLCAGCHGGDPADFEMTPAIAERWPRAAVRKQDRSWVPEFCGRCHGDAALMRRYDPRLPVDQLLKYRESRHGRLLLGEKKDSRVAECVSCHGTHGIRAPSSPRSKVHPTNVAATCARCHEDAERMKGAVLADGSPMPLDQVAKWKQSVHGKALLEKGDLGAPTCNDCHGDHAAMPPAISSVSQVCRNCHVHNAELFDGSPHKTAFERNGWPECETCHGKHAIERPTEAMLAPDGTCETCHREHGTPQCREVPPLFLAKIAAVRNQRAATDAAIAEAAEVGMPTDDLRFEAAALDDARVELRARIHAFDRETLVRPADEAIALGARIEQDARARVEDYRVRRLGALVSTLIVTLFAGLLYLKIRQLDRAGA